MRSCKSLKVNIIKFCDQDGGRVAKVGKGVIEEYGRGEEIGGKEVNRG